MNCPHLRRSNWPKAEEWCDLTRLPCALPEPEMYCLPRWQFVRQKTGEKKVC